MPDDAELATALLDLVTAHTQHARRVIGRCVLCECGARWQGHLGGNVAAYERRYIVVLADGFACLVTDRRERADDCAARHPGSRVDVRLEAVP